MLVSSLEDFREFEFVVCGIGLRWDIRFKLYGFGSSRVGNIFVFLVFKC